MRSHVAAKNPPTSRVGLTLSGTHHRGIDDARNSIIARASASERGCLT